MLRSRRRRNRIAFAVALAVLIVAVEFGARLYLTLASSPQEIPDALVPEWSKLSGIVKGDYWIYRDFHGRYYNIDDGARRTVGQPARYDKTVWLFGNSGMFDPDVADGDTTASYLQAILNAHAYRWRVVNLAVGGANSSAEYARLRDTPVSAGDLVLFIDATRDSTLRDCSYPLATLVVMCQSQPYFWFTRDDVAHYWNNISRARLYAQARRVSFLQFVQPCFTWLALQNPFGAPLVTLPDSDYYSGCHMTPRGNAATARALYDSITTF